MGNGSMMLADRPAIEVERLAAGYGDRPVFDDVTFRVPRGTMSALIGLNGAGKTTLLRIMCGLKRAEHGAVRIDGRDVARDRAALAGLALVQQSVVVDTQLTGREYVMFSAGAHGVRRRAARAAIAEVTEELELEAFIDLPVDRCSGGQARRLQIAAALARRPNMLLLDEPTTGLDASARRTYWRALRDLSLRRDVTMLVVTHFFDEAGLADEVLVMAGGRLMSAERPEHLLERASLFVVEITCEWRDDVQRVKDALVGYRVDVTTTTVSVITPQPSAVLAILVDAGLAATAPVSTRPANLDDALVHLSQGGSPLGVPEQVLR